VKGAPGAQFEGGFGGQAWLVAAAEAIATEVVSAHQGEYERLARDEIARQTEVEQGNPAPAVAVVRPALRRELDSGRALEGAERDCLRVAPVLDGSGEQGLIANELFVVGQIRLDVHALDACIKANSRCKGALAERMGNAELREHRPAAQGPR